MSVDYEGIGGYGIPLTDETISRIKELSEVTDEQWEEDLYWELCAEGDINNVWIRRAGSAYSGEDDYYLAVKGETLQEVIDYYPLFLSYTKELGLDINLSDILLIEDMYVS